MDNNNVNEQNQQENVPQTAEKENVFLSAVKKGFETVVRWVRRAFFGGSNELYKERKDDDDQEPDAKVFEVEKIESPGKQRIKSFLSRKLAVGATVILVLMFALMMIGPFFSPYTADYMESSQANVRPGMNMMSVPGEMAKEVESISSVSKFSVGLSKSGKVYVWGDGEALAWNINKIPDEVKNANVKFAAAGSDHAIAIDSEGKIHGWGASDLAQYGSSGGDINKEFLYTYMPDELVNGTIDVSQVKQLVCGIQSTAIVMKDGSVYMWGNHQTIKNMKAVKALTNVDKICFTNTAAIALLKDGTIFTGAVSTFDTFPATTVDGTQVSLDTREYLSTHNLKVVDIGAARGSVALVLDDGSILIAGNIFSTENRVPGLAAGEKYISVVGGMKHYTAITSLGRVISWGDNYWSQTVVPDGATGAAEVFAGPFQNYAVDASGKVMEKWGLSGYLMGTDEMGRDIWNRILNGGRLTMTIGAISVIISSIIGIIVGCLSGYFGGWVDMLLMRLSEIVSAIPFLPFALILSIVCSSMGLSESVRIVMIMIILGLLSWTGLARLVRGQVLAEREKEFVLAAKAMGVKEGKIAFKHILPNIISIIIVTMTLDFASCMLTESSLSYLGFGVQLPRPTWGNMLDGASNSIVIQNYWWRWVIPSVFLMITTICINIIGDALRDVMDPKSSAER